MNNGQRPAHPAPEGLHNTGDFGLSKREYFAGLAMQGLCASGFFTEPRLQKQAEQVGGTISTAIAVSAIDIADELLKELEKPQS